MSGQAKKIEYDNPGTIMGIVAGAVADIFWSFFFLGLFFPPLLVFPIVTHYLAAIFIYAFILRKIKHLLPKIVLLLVLLLPLPILFVGTLIALLLQNRFVEFVVTQAAIMAVGAATGGAGAVAGEAAAGTAAVGEAGVAVGEAAGGAVARGAESIAAKGAEKVAEGAAEKGARGLGGRFGEWAKDEAKGYARDKAEKGLDRTLGGNKEEPTLDELLYEGAPPGTLEETEQSLEGYDLSNKMLPFPDRQNKEKDVTLEDDGSVDLRKAA
ncbi:MAG: hypothetical protein AAB495_00695 [Patescibacteria group bacterium]